jgi:hypothetical protein
MIECLVHQFSHGDIIHYCFHNIFHAFVLVEVNLDVQWMSDSEFIIFGCTGLKVW